MRHVPERHLLLGVLLLAQLVALEVQQGCDDVNQPLPYSHDPSLLVLYVQHTSEGLPTDQQEILLSLLVALLSFTIQHPSNDVY